MLTKQRIYGLDGVRTIALFCVLFGHSASTPLTPWSGIQEWFPDLGKTGVLIFFVLSGFLQTELLVSDEEKYGAISPLRFYAKRLLRIAPLFLVYLLFITLWSAATSYDTTGFDGVSVLLYFKHIVDGAPLLIHFWSLSLEVLFYLAWPFILMRIPRLRRGPITLALALLLPITSPLIRLLIADTDSFYPSQFFRAEAIFLGCWLAFARREKEGRAWQKNILRGRDTAFAITSLLLAMVLFLDGHYSHLPWMSPLCYAARVGLCLLFVNAAMDCQSRFGFSLLNSKVARWLAMVSYGTYVWQQFFFFGNPNDWIGAWIPRTILFHSFWFPGNLMLAVLFGAASYYIIEKPLHPWRVRIADSFTSPNAGQAIASSPNGNTLK